MTTAATTSAVDEAVVTFEVVHPQLRSKTTWTLAELQLIPIDKEGVRLSLLLGCTELFLQCSRTLAKSPLRHLWMRLTRPLSRTLPRLGSLALTTNLLVYSFFTSSLCLGLGATRGSQKSCV